LDLLKPEDFAALVAHCETFANFLAAIRIVRAEVSWFTTRRLVRRISNRRWRRLRPLRRNWGVSCREFGLTPSAEQQLGSVTPDDVSAYNPFGA
jgi:phage terminase small subunit